VPPPGARSLGFRALPGAPRARSLGFRALPGAPRARSLGFRALPGARMRLYHGPLRAAAGVDPTPPNGHHGGVQTPYLELRRLTKNYGKREAVRGLSFSLARGGIVGLLGPNGAGKSTTISMLTGLLSPTGGDILWEGRSINARMREWRRALGVVLEDLSLFEYLSVREHLTLTGRLAGLDAAETERRSTELIEMLQLGDFTDTIAAEASQGTRKKLALALCLIHAPRLLLLDEALNGIDAVTVSVVKKLLRNLAGRGITVIMSSHVLDSVETIVDRCLIMDRGVVARDAAIADIRASGNTLEQVYTETLTDGARAVPELAWIG
jgi:ABC-2 type transport system ATP-binding protein